MSICRVCGISTGFKGAGGKVVSVLVPNRHAARPSYYDRRMVHICLKPQCAQTLEEMVEEAKKMAPGIGILYLDGELLPPEHISNYWKKAIWARRKEAGLL